MEYDWQIETVHKNKVGWEWMVDLTVMRQAENIYMAELTDPSIGFEWVGQCPSNKIGWE